MTDLTAVVFAYSEVGYLCLEELLEAGVSVKALFTCGDDPKEEQWFPSVSKLAEKEGIPVHTPSLLGDKEYTLVRSLGADALFSFYYRSMIPERFLAIPPKGAFNIHGSLLPKYRGRACVNWAVLKGETETGATLHFMTKRADAGDIVDRQAVPILFTDTALEVSRKVAEAARLVLRRNLTSLAEGNPSRTPQKEEDATLFGRRTPEDGRIRWGQSSLEIYNLVRAVTHPFPGAFTRAGGRKLFVWKVLPGEEHAEGVPPGTVLSLSPFRVACGDGVLHILSSQWENEDERTGQESSEGLTPGEVLGN